MRRILVVALVAVLALIAVSGWLFTSSRQAAVANQLTASGTIEAETVRVAAQVGGRIEALLADEGDEVQAGQVLAHLDETLLRAELKKGQAALAAAQAQLAQVQTGARPEDIRKAEVAVKLARIARDGAGAAWQDAKAARHNSQELNLKIAAARTQLAVAEARLEQAVAATGVPQAEYDLWAQVWTQIHDLFVNPKTVCIPLAIGGQICREIRAGPDQVENASFQWNVATQKLTGAWDAVALATAARDAAKANLDALLAQRDRPLAANAQVNAAWTQYQTAEGAVKEAEAALAMVRAGATPEQIQMAKAGVRQVEATVKALQVQLDKMTLRAPISGLVTARSVQEGEMAVPGVSLFTLANLDQVHLTLYIPETQIARVKVGQKVTVRVDSFPNRTFEGRVTFISPQAEFTPRAVQTQEERAKMVFAVKVTIANPDHALKPGMPADAVIEEAP